MHPVRLKERGFNQAVVLSKLLSKQLHIPYDIYCCKKVKNTANQAHLKKEERRKNLKASFRVSPIAYQHVLVVDDLLTTGSTANEVSFQLKQAGVQHVDIVCLARTVRA